MHKGIILWELFCSFAILPLVTKYLSHLWKLKSFRDRRKEEHINNNDKEDRLQYSDFDLKELLDTGKLKKKCKVVPEKYIKHHNLRVWEQTIRTYCTTLLQLTYYRVLLQLKEIFGVKLTMTVTVLQVEAMQKKSNRQLIQNKLLVKYLDKTVVLIHQRRTQAHPLL